MGIRRLGELRGRPLRRLVAVDKIGSLPDASQYSVGPTSEATHLLTEWVEGMSETGLKITDPETWFTWKHRCLEVYEGKKVSTPTKVILREAKKMTANLHKRYSAEHRFEFLKACKGTLEDLMRDLCIGEYNRGTLTATFTREEEQWVIMTPIETSLSAQHKITDRQDALEGRQPKERDGPHHEAEARSSMTVK
ncbi:hypothetical protein R1sor_011823 [Riccia sorocarpa]|uniref:Uncharacterized protein n=1 Tax=Riccia sorocarpa TaxID=122646 RepID=A0ABD3I4N7_9MARC